MPWAVVCDEYTSERRATKAQAEADLHAILDYGACHLEHEVIRVPAANGRMGPET